MKKIYNNQKPAEVKTGENEINDLPGYPLYPESEDIFSRSIKEDDLNPEDISNKKKSPENHLESIDLDIPGSELDNDMEIIGSEDEENNYYSIGGDDHIDLDERQDD
ncbi:MAG: hypothetical protein JZU47_13495 [Prolixibacteraceae bacterium]|nr:hypothetical protein [Prolixibacteraceae bacterium]